MRVKACGILVVNLLVQDGIDSMWLPLAFQAYAMIGFTAGIDM